MLATRNDVENTVSTLRSGKPLGGRGLGLQQQTSKSIAPSSKMAINPPIKAAKPRVETRRALGSLSTNFAAPTDLDPGKGVVKKSSGPVMLSVVAPPPKAQAEEEEDDEVEVFLGKPNFDPVSELEKEVNAEPIIFPPQEVVKKRKQSLQLEDTLSSLASLALDALTSSDDDDDEEDEDDEDIKPLEKVPGSAIKSKTAPRSTVNPTSTAPPRALTATPGPAPAPLRSLTATPAPLRSLTTATPVPIRSLATQAQRPLVTPAPAPGLSRRISILSTIDLDLGIPPQSARKQQPLQSQINLQSAQQVRRSSIVPSSRPKNFNLDDIAPIVAPDNEPSLDELLAE